MYRTRKFDMSFWILLCIVKYLFFRAHLIFALNRKWTKIRCTRNIKLLTNRRGAMRLHEHIMRAKTRFHDCAKFYALEKKGVFQYINWGFVWYPYKENIRINFNISAAFSRHWHTKYIKQSFKGLQFFHRVS